jgi:hypothetical protein
MPDPRQPPPFDALLSIDAVKYEYDMAHSTAVLLAGGESYQPAEAFAILESFLVHARNLHDFFRPRTESAIINRATNLRSSHSGSVWALDFVPDFGVETYDREVIEKINRWLQHVTTWRQEEEEHPRWSPSMLLGIYESMNEFLAQLDGEYRQRLLGTHHQVGEFLRAAGLLA